jgi:hypothetical protein
MAKLHVVVLNEPGRERGVKDKRNIFSYNGAGSVLCSAAAAAAAPLFFFALEKSHEVKYGTSAPVEAYCKKE